MKQYTFSVIIPAHNEEQYIGKCLKAIRRAAERVRPDGVQVIVAANRCTDQTAAIAKKLGAEVLENSDDSIGKIRNAGARAAKGRILVTIDADSRMSSCALCEILQMLRSGKYIGGGARPVFDRMSLGIFCSSMYVAANLLPIAVKNRTLPVGGMFWCLKRDFDAIGGFDETLVSLEDMDFAVRLTGYGRSRGLRYTVLRKSFFVTSSRKFDKFGDWYLLKDRKMTKRIFTGTDRKAADRFYYDFNG